MSSLHVFIDVVLALEHLAAVQRTPIVFRVLDRLFVSLVLVVHVPNLAYRTLRIELVPRSLDDGVEELIQDCSGVSRSLSRARRRATARGARIVRHDPHVRDGARRLWPASMRCRGARGALRLATNSYKQLTNFAKRYFFVDRNKSSKAMRFGADFLNRASMDSFGIADSNLSQFAFHQKR